MFRLIYNRVSIGCLILSLFAFHVDSIVAQNFKVIIDAGHGGKDPGAIGKVGKEKDINLGVALRLGEMIKDKHPGVKVIFTRDDDFFVELQERANIANRSKAQLFISIHTNSSKSNEARGTETYTMGLRRSNENLEVAKRENSVILLENDYKVKYEGFDPTSSESYIMFELLHDRFIDQSIGFASSIQKEFRSVDLVDRGVRQDVFLVLRNTGMPSVLVEVGYISNPNEEAFLISKAGQDKIASSIYSAFCQFKRNYDNRQGRQMTEAPKTNNVIAVPEAKSQDTLEKSKPVEKATEIPAKVIESNAATSNAVDTDGKILYKLQILVSPSKLRTNSPLLKGEEANYYEEKGLYKYTIGATNDLQEINKLRKEMSAKFKDCFVIGFKNGEKIKLNK